MNLRARCSHGACALVSYPVVGHAPTGRRLHHLWRGEFLAKKLSLVELAEVHRFRLRSMKTERYCS
jgi:hypothetical protein